jgi:hypothetical protein
MLFLSFHSLRRLAKRLTRLPGNISVSAVRRPLALLDRKEDERALCSFTASLSLLPATVIRLRASSLRATPIPSAACKNAEQLARRGHVSK